MMYNKKWIQVFAIWISVIVPYCARGQDAVPAASQDPVVETPRITLGAKIGTSLNQFSQPGTTIGVNIGAFGKFHVTDFLDARMELLFSVQGGGRPNYTRYVDDGTFTGTSVGVANIQAINPSVTFNTIEIPVLAELGLPEFKDLNIQPKLLLGMSYSMVMSSIEHRTQRYNFNDGTAVDVGYTRDEVNDNYKRNQFSVIAGLGVNYNLGKRVFHMDIRYRQGLTQVNQILYPVTSFSNGSSAGGGGKLYSSSLIFNFGMTLFNF